MKTIKGHVDFYLDEDKVAYMNYFNEVSGYWETIEIKKIIGSGATRHLIEFFKNTREVCEENHESK